MKPDNILAVEAEVNVLKPGAIILFKTNSGNYGKLKVVSIGNASTNYLLTCDVVTYDFDATDVTILAKKAGFTIEKGYFCDLDTFAKSTSGDSDADFKWALLNDSMVFYVGSPAIFYLYSN